MSVFLKNHFSVLQRNTRNQKKNPKNDTRMDSEEEEEEDSRRLEEVLFKTSGSSATRQAAAAAAAAEAEARNGPGSNRNNLTTYGAVEVARAASLLYLQRIRDSS